MLILPLIYHYTDTFTTQVLSVAVVAVLYTGWWPTSLWPTYRMEVGVLVKAEWSRGEQESKPGIPLCSMPAPGPVLIQYIMSKLLLAAAPIETLIKAIRGSSWGGAGG